MASGGFVRIASGCFALLVVLSARPPQAAQDPQPVDQQAPTFRTGVNLVRVDVVATDRSGHQVLDLTTDDFEVTDEGKRQPITAFKLVSSDGGKDSDSTPTTSSDASEEINSSPDDVRLFAVFMDDYSVSPRWEGVAREQVARFVKQSLGPADLIAVMHPLTPLDDVRLVRNRDSVSVALNRFDGVRGVNAADGDPNRGSIGTIRRDASLSALKALIMRLGSLKEGRKTLILVTEGFGNSYEQLDELKALGDLASRNNTAIYPVLARIARPGYKDDVSVGGETLRILAERSGGRVIFDATKDSGEYRERATAVGRLPVSKLSIAMEQITVDASHYYLLGYNAADAAPDGQFHKIGVRVKRPGVELRYRKGYLSLKPGEAPPPTITSVPTTPVERTRAFDTASRDRMVLTWVGMSRGENGTTRVTVAWDPRPATPPSTPPMSRLAGTPGAPMSPAPFPASGTAPAANSSPRPEERPARLALKVTGADAATLFEGRTPFATTSGGGSSQTFDVPPGRLQLRFSVENAAGIVLDSELQNIVVPDLVESAALMSTPAIYRTRSVAEWRQVTTSGAAAPTAQREFDRADRLLIRVSTYASGSAPGAREMPLTATLVSRGGQTLSALQPARTQAPAASSSTPASSATWDVDLPLASLARGDYGVRLVASDADDTATELVAFRVN